MPRGDNPCPTASRPCRSAIFVMSSVKTIPLAGAPPSTRFTLKIAFSTTPARESIVAVTKSTASRARSRLLTLNSNISQLPSLRNRAMAGWSAGYRAARVRRQLTPGPISLLRKTAGLPPFISFSTSYRELDSVVRRPMLRIGKRREEYFAVAQAALLEAKHRKSIGNPGEKRLSPRATGKRAVRRHAGSNQRFPRCARQDCLPLGVHSSARRTRGWRKDEFSKCFAIREKIGGRDRVRTCDPLLAKQVLSQLSYTPTFGVTFILKHFRALRNPFLRFS